MADETPAEQAQDKEPYEFGGEDYADYMSGMVVQNDREILRAIKILGTHLSPYLQQPVIKLVEDWEEQHPSLEMS